MAWHINVQKSMCKLSKLHKNAIHISFYQIYLPKLDEIILKYYRMNLFKETTIGFNYNLQIEIPCKPFQQSPCSNW